MEATTVPPHCVDGVSRYGLQISEIAIASRMMTADPTPEELVTALDARPDAKAVFEALPPSHRREYETWVQDAKKAETRHRRAAQAVARLLADKPGEA